MGVGITIFGGQLLDFMGISLVPGGYFPDSMKISMVREYRLLPCFNRTLIE